MSQVTNKLRVCIIGAGAGGLCALRHLAGDPATFEPTAYERMNQLGGTWVYNENVEVDVQTSMYENLRTNLPGEIMNFPDWRKMGGDTKSSCITHAQVLSYLEDYANHFDLQKYIKFNSRIESVRAENSTGIVLSASSSLPATVWKVRIKNLANQTTEEKEFDAVLCCNGHFSQGYTPSIPGMETFPGQILHSHDYRKPDSFAGKTVVILGASSSGVDIGIELTGYAHQVYLSHNKPRITCALPANLTQVTGVTGVDGNRFLLKDGTSLIADTFVYCTGYNYSFPFLDESCKIAIEDNYIHPLYKHMINIEQPTMCLIGIPSSVIPFPLFHVQVQYFVALLKGNASLPSNEIMLEDSTCKTTNQRHAHRFRLNEQWDYSNSLIKDGHLDPLPPMYQAGYSVWQTHRNQDLWHYRESKFVVAGDGLSVQIIMNDNNAA